ncbi:MAG: hypothetical protein BWY21_02234 [Parcubacteria group bacterium ADurb.Bin216]|nr:MAG: hypothetical protein BWY21_02234 [Parcubacteria group bacterium ADurb.Bin216]
MDYLEIRDKMKTGDCLLFSSFSPIAVGIKAFTHSEWSHAALVIRLREYEGEERHRYYIEATSPTVKLTRLSAKMIDYTGYIAWLPLPTDMDEARTIMGCMMLQLIDKKYDYKSIFKQMFRKVSTDADSLFCSELCGYIWGITCADGKAPTPADIPGLSIFKGIEPVIIYDGRNGHE